MNEEERRPVWSGPRERRWWIAGAAVLYLIITAGAARVLWKMFT